jgi:hypothetical protein
MARDIPDISELVFCSWLLATRDSRLPSGAGILDRALERATKGTKCPPWVAPLLHFIDTDAGRECLELPRILEWARRSDLTAALNTTYRYAEIKITSAHARAVLDSLGVDEKEAVAWGHELQNAINEVSRQQSARRTSHVSSK